MQINETTYNAMPAHLRALFVKLPNPGKEEVLAGFPESNDGVAGKRSGVAHVTLHGLGARDEEWGGYGGGGSAARFFYCAKASRKDRNEGCEGMEQRGAFDGAEGQMGCNMGSRSKPRENHHPTVKPTDLMAYLCRLVTPPGGVVLDPFMGSGSTGKAAVREGFHFVGIEREAEYLRIAQARISAQVAATSAQQIPPLQSDLFSEILRA